MGGCCSTSFFGPDIHYCKKCHRYVIESYPETICQGCETVLFVAKKEPKPFAMPHENNRMYFSVLHGTIIRV